MGRMSHSLSCPTPSPQGVFYLELSQTVSTHSTIAQGLVVPPQATTHLRVPNSCEVNFPP